MARMSKGAKAVWKEDLAAYKEEIRNARKNGDADTEQWARSELKLFRQAPKTHMADYYEDQAAQGY